MHDLDLHKLDLSSLSGDEYAKLLTCCEAAPEVLRRDGYVVVAPPATTELGRIGRSEVGSRPRSILDVLGLYDHVVDYILENLKPHCAQCECDAAAPKTLESCHFPETGVIALSVVDPDSGISLREQAELLGVERAYVNGYLVSARDLEHEQGEPVLCATAATDIQELAKVAEHWFARGGRQLRVLHYASRSSEGQELGVIYDWWSCPQCNRPLPKASRATLQDVPSCVACRGEGWIAAPEKWDSQRWLACRECDGLGFRVDAASYRFRGLRLSQVLVISFTQLQQVVTEESPGHNLLPLLEEVCAAGLDSYPLGAAYDLCSPGERMLIAVAQLRLARLEQTTCLLDGAYGDLFSPLGNDTSGRALSVVRLGVQVTRERVPRLEVPRDASQIVLRQVYHGPLWIDEVSFPLGAVTAIQGPVGAGKSLLLQIIAKRFSLRRKQAHVVHFGNLQRCWFAHGICEPQGTLLSVLDFANELANEIAKNRQAKELGILASDLELPRSKYRCEECLGVGLTKPGEVCTNCQGALYDWRVAELPLFGATVREILSAPMSRTARELWSGPSTEVILGVLEDLGMQELSLSTPTLAISPALRRTLTIAALLAKVGSRGRGRVGLSDLAHQLVLLDGPRVMPEQHQNVIGRLLYGLSQRGATILYASMPEGLESSCQSVLRLGWSVRNATERAASSYLDQRFARTSTIVV